MSRQLGTDLVKRGTTEVLELQQVLLPRPPHQNMTVLRLLTDSSPEISVNVHLADCDVSRNMAGHMSVEIRKEQEVQTTIFRAVQRTVNLQTEEIHRRHLLALALVAKV